MIHWEHARADSPIGILVMTSNETATHHASVPDRPNADIGHSGDLRGPTGLLTPGDRNLQREPRANRQFPQQADGDIEMHDRLGAGHDPRLWVIHDQPREVEFERG